MTTPFLDKIKKLNIVFFKYDLEKAPHLGLPDDEQLGFLAQEVQEIFPELVVEENGHLAIKIAWLPFYLLRAIQEQQAIIEKLSTKGS